MTAWLPRLPAPLLLRPPSVARRFGFRDLRSSAIRGRWRPISSRSAPRPSHAAPDTPPSRMTWKSSATQSRSARSSRRYCPRRRVGATGCWTWGRGLVGFRPDSSGHGPASTSCPRSGTPLGRGHPCVPEAHKPGRIATSCESFESHSRTKCRTRLSFRPRWRHLAAPSDSRGRPRRIGDLLRLASACYAFKKGETSPQKRRRPKAFGPNPT